MSLNSQFSNLRNFLNASHNTYVKPIGTVSRILPLPLFLSQENKIFGSRYSKIFIRVPLIFFALGSSYTHNGRIFLLKCLCFSNYGHHKFIEALHAEAFEIVSYLFLLGVPAVCQGVDRRRLDKERNVYCGHQKQGGQHSTTSRDPRN